MANLAEFQIDAACPWRRPRNCCECGAMVPYMQACLCGNEPTGGSREPDYGRQRMLQGSPTYGSYYDQR